MIRRNELAEIKIGDRFRNVHTGVCQSLTAIDEVKTYNPITKKRDAIITVYVLGANRWNTAHLCPNWEMVSSNADSKTEGGSEE